MEQVDEVQADLRVLTPLVYRWTRELPRYPLFRHLEANPQLSQQLSQPGVDGMKLIKGDKDMWAHVCDGASQHLEGLLAAHQLLVAVSDVCHQAAGALLAVHTITQPMLISTGREVLSGFMNLLCDTARMALLLNEAVPRRQIPALMHACHHKLMSESPHPTSPPSSPAPILPSTDLPIYHMTSMVQFLQHVMRPLTPRVQQVLELSLAPSLASLFTPATTSSKPLPATAAVLNGTDCSSQACMAQLPPIFDVVPHLDPQTITHNKTVRMGPGGMQMHAAHALCIRFESLTSWVLFGYLLCPAALLHPLAVRLLTQVLRTEVLLTLYEERCCSVGALYEEALAPVTEVPQYSGVLASGSLYTSGLQYSRQHSRALREAQASVKAAREWAAAHAAQQQQRLRLECIRAVRDAVAACKANPSLLSINLVMLLALLSMSKYAVLWFFRHSEGHGQPATPGGTEHPTTSSAGSTAATAPHSAANSSGGHTVEDPLSVASNTKVASDKGMSLIDPPLSSVTAWSKGTAVGSGASCGGGVIRTHFSPADVVAGWDEPGDVVGTGTWSGRRSSSTLTFTGGLQLGGGRGPQGVRVAGQVLEGRLSVLELMGAMEQLVTLLDHHMDHVKDCLKDRVNQLMQRQVIPGHMRLATNGNPTPARAVTMTDVQRVIALANQLLHPSRVVTDQVLVPPALAHTWRTTQMHTIMQPSAAFPEGAIDPSAMSVQAPQGEPTRELPRDAVAAEGNTSLLKPHEAEGSDHNAVVVGEGASTGAPIPTSQANSCIDEPPHAPKGPVPRPRNEHQTQVEDRTLQNLRDCAIDKSGGTAEGPSSSGVLVGLAAPQVAAATQDPLFLTALQEVVEALCWHANPAHMLREHISLRDLVHTPAELHHCVHAALGNPHTAHLAVAAIQSLHWMSIPKTGIANEDGPHQSWALASQLMEHITFYLKDCMAPLLAPSTRLTSMPSLSRKPTGPLACAAAVGDNSSARTNPGPGCCAQVMACILPLCVALAEAGTVQVTATQAIVPVQYVRHVLHVCLESLLSNLALEVPVVTGGGTREEKSSSGGSAAAGLPHCAGRSTEVSWRPAVALQRVRVLLHVAGELQPLLGPDTQQDLQAILFGGPTTAVSSVNNHSTPGSQGTPDMAWPLASPVRNFSIVSPYRTPLAGVPVTRPYVKAVVAWYTYNVLDDNVAPGCCYSPILEAFLAPIGSRTPCGGSGQYSTSSTSGGANRRRTGSEGGSSSSMVPPTPSGMSMTLARLKNKLHKDPGVIVTGEVTAPLHAGPIHLAPAGPLPGACEVGTGGGMTGVGKSGGGDCEVVLGVDDLMALVELCGPDAVQILTASCRQLMERGLAQLDTHLQARHSSLDVLVQLLGLPANKAGTSCGEGSQAIVLVSEEGVGREQALWAHAARIVAAKQGVYSAWELSKVQSTLHQLARCVGLRRMLATAVHRAAEVHSGDWVAGMQQLSLPQEVRAADAFKPATSLFSLGGDVVENPEVLDCSVYVQPMDCVATIAMASEPKRLKRAMPDVPYNTLWQLPRPSQAQGHNEWLPALTVVDPMLVDLVAAKVQTPSDCSRWVLLPALLALCIGLPSPSRMAGGPMAYRSSAQLRTTPRDVNLLVLASLTAGWHNAVSQALRSPAALADVLPMSQAHQQFEAVASLAANVRQQLTQSVHPNRERQPSTSGAQRLLVGEAQKSWGAVFSAAIRGF